MLHSVLFGSLCYRYLLVSHYTSVSFLRLPFFFLAQFLRMKWGLIVIARQYVVVLEVTLILFGWSLGLPALLFRVIPRRLTPGASSDSPLLSRAAKGVTRISEELPWLSESVMGSPDTIVPKGSLGRSVFKPRSGVVL